MGFLENDISISDVLNFIAKADSTYFNRIKEEVYKRIPVEPTDYVAEYSEYDTIKIGDKYYEIDDSAFPDGESFYHLEFNISKEISKEDAMDSILFNAEIGWKLTIDEASYEVIACYNGPDCDSEGQYVVVLLK